MNLQMNTRNLECVFEQLSDISPSTEPQEQYQYTVPIMGGTGRVQRIMLRRGMEINWFEASLSEPVTMDVGIQYPHLEITYTLSGQGCWKTEGRASDFALAPGVSNFIFIQDSKVHAELYPQERLWHMELRLDIRQFRELHPDVARLTDGSVYCRQTAGSPHIAHIVEQMTQCPYSGSLRKLYLEGKANELLVHHLDGAQKEERVRTEISKLNAEDIRCLHEAREILTHCWRKPPSLLELARLAGLNDYKLKLGFKELFGTTVFGYVRALRMNEARKILEKGEGNVSEAALMVGYHNISHFAALFRKTYGYNPSELGKANAAAQAHHRTKSVQI
ncbi:helix-turn-helix transcriptional regulator [Paenibacillus thiaminolyticus]|uniref:AraC family transcriptional regulator n=1 Tax=Paenibacillus thiaminolyticus TaxID=49283 RepID=A0A3A3GBE0_PANTH|nr:helix-turn-helix transcriptional regulator [Paenibacillus thiaminolyticus]RJG19145.1 AraC family transcriptional regulator [Paenibacillus thiaminolyticus]